MNFKYLLCSLFLTVISAKYVPVYVMLQLNTVSNNNQLNNPTQFASQMEQLKSGNVDGIMTDVWWGLVEKNGPNQYDWSAYQQMFSIVKSKGLKMQVVMDFHRCGGNVGDNCDITLPPWVLEVGKKNENIFYKSSSGTIDQEYLSSGVDHERIFPGASQKRTAVDMYSDYIQSFVSTFSDYFDGTITLIEVGLGPAGEMRYPSYQLKYWTFCGVGEFQANDTYLQKKLQTAASEAGHPEWGHVPTDAGTWDSSIEQTNFFNPNGPNPQQNFASPYGQFFLEWYSQTLIAHGNTILAQAKKIISGYNVEIAGKVSGVHWLYNTPSHAAEQTAGYKNDKGTAYAPIAAMFNSNNASFDFTAFEMLNNQQPPQCLCNPEQLVYQTLVAAKANGVRYDGENALPRYDTQAYQTIEWESDRVMLVNGFTYLRLGTTLLNNSQNWETFKTFVKNMHTLL